MTSRLLQRTAIRHCLPRRLHQPTGFSSHTRLFTTVFQTPWKRTGPKRKRTVVYALDEWKYAETFPPPYPYEASQKLFNQSRTGLYGGLRVKFGDKISPRKNKTRRTWHPNIVHKKLYSVAMGRMLKVKVATRVMRTVDKSGGLDEYLLGSTPARLKELGEEGWRLRWVILQALKDSDRVRNDPRLMLELRSGMPRDGVWEREVVGTTVALPSHDVESDDGPEERRRFTDAEVEEAVQRRIEDGRHMREERPPTTLLQRMGHAITGPFRKLLGRR